MAAVLASGVLAWVFPEANAQAQHNAPMPAPAKPAAPARLAAQAQNAAKAKADKEKAKETATDKAAEKKAEKKADKAPAAPTVPEIEPPGAKGALPSSMDAIAKAVSTPYKPAGGGHLV
ncbi:MAG TPA: hypothetical protein VHO25_13240, partial [Polyangiaceae bacterium]|nr:hypothetical protein [Polyangiaceae bacterium]